MKLKKLLSILFCAFACNLQAQTYSLTTNTATYNNLVGSTSLNGTATWDDPEYEIPIGFDFQYFGETLSTIYINDIGLGGFLSESSSDNGVQAILQPYGSDIMDRGYDFAIDDAPTGSQSTISYLLEGVAGSRILKIEWKNVGFFSDIEQNGASNSNFTNFQLWLFENDNSIEMHYGSNSITDLNLAFDGDPGTFIVLAEAFNFDNETLGANGALLLSGSPSNPTLNMLTDLNENSLVFLNGVIPNGTVYRFTTSALSIDEFKTTKVNLSPNPAIDIMTISGINQTTSYIIYDVAGREITKGLVSKYANALDVEHLTSGLYIIQFENRNALKFTKR